MNLGDAYKNVVLDFLFGNLASPPPTTFYLALYTAAPSSSGGGTEVPTTNGYARVAVSNDGSTWAASALGVKTTIAALTFPTASGSWGTITDYAFHDDPTADSIVEFGPLDTPVPVTSGETPQFNAGSAALTITAA